MPFALCLTSLLSFPATDPPTPSFRNLSLVVSPRRPRAPSPILAIASSSPPAASTGGRFESEEVDEIVSDGVVAADELDDGPAASADSSWSSLPVIPFPRSVTGGFHIRWIQHYGGLPGYSAKNRRYGERIPEILESLREHLGNGTLQVTYPPTPLHPFF